MDTNDISQIHSEDYSIEHLLFVFSQAEKRLKDSNKAYEYTTTKTVTVLSITIAIFTAITSYFFLNFDSRGVFSPILITAGFASVYSFLILRSLMKNVKSYEYHPLGSSPEKLFVEKPENLTQEEFFKDILHSEIKNYIDRIKVNYEFNKNRVARLDSSICYLIYMPIFSVVVFLITMCLS